MSFVRLPIVQRLLIAALVATTSACGNGTDSTELNVSAPIGTVTTSPAGASSTPAPPTMHAPDVEATTVTEQPRTLTLHVSNQSFVDDPVGITISIDGETVVDNDFYVEGQHSWITFELAVSPGDHELVMTSSTGVTQAASLIIPAEGHRWAVVNYWFYPADLDHQGGGQTPRSFTFTVDDEPISFD